MEIILLYALGWVASVAAYLYYNRDDFSCYEFVWRDTIIEAMLISFLWPLCIPFWLVYITIVYIMKYSMGKL